MDEVRDKYYRDPQFKNLVDALYMEVCKLHFSFSEIREAVLLAQLKYEMQNPRAITFSPDFLNEVRLRGGEVNG